MKFRTKITFFILIFISVLSCKNGEKNKVAASPDRLLKDSLYLKKWLQVDFGQGRIEEVEIYISKNNDTITNQYKPLKIGEVDTLNSEFYDLKISNADRENVYHGKITVLSKYYKLELNEKNRKELEFHYWQQNIDSTWLSLVKIKNSDSVEFKFVNSYNDRLQGVLYLTVERDTISKNEKMVNMFILPLLVDNRKISDNVFLETFMKENKFNPNKLNLKIK